MKPSPQHIASAFLERPAIDLWSGKPSSVAVREIGRLHLPSGQIVACDPSACPETPPFPRAVPPGTYPLRLAIATDRRGDQRVAYAGVFCSDAHIEHWELADIPEAAGGRPDMEYRYGVDSATGCFGAAEAMSRFEAALEEWPEYMDQLTDQLKETYVDTWSWAECAQFGPDGNVFLFSSGHGDGSYPSYFGLDATGAAVCVVTNFRVLGEDQESFEASPRKSWWKFWKR